MSDSRNDSRDVAPGLLESLEGTRRGAIGRYVVGLVLSIVLTAAAFYVVRSDLVWGPAIPVALAVLAIAQMGVQLVFFLRITSGPENTNNALALAFGVLIVVLVVAGSLWIMDHLNANMLTPDQVMRMQR
jgi:cytochrome o ubiquinol oxidase operon protein cyoD